MIKKGFTLSEVLITLGVIGVVAAMTLPTLIQNYQKHVWVNQLKKSVSVIEQGFQKMLADDGVDNLENSGFRTTMDMADPDYGQDYGCFGSSIDFTEFHNYLKKYFNIIKFHSGDGRDCHVATNSKGEEHKSLSGQTKGYYDSDTRKIYLADGSVFGFWGYTHCGDAEGPYCGTLGIDVNGDEKGPNQIGRDTFYFHISKTGNLIPVGSKKYADDLGDQERYWKNGNIGYSCDKSSGYGFGCSARIIENGWKMDY